MLNREANRYGAMVLFSTFGIALFKLSKSFHSTPMLHYGGTNIDEAIVTKDYFVPAFTALPLFVVLYTGIVLCFKSMGHTNDRGNIKAHQVLGIMGLSGTIACLNYLQKQGMFHI